jgi:hypothetical protein
VLFANVVRLSVARPNAMERILAACLRTKLFSMLVCPSFEISRFFLKMPKIKKLKKKNFFKKKTVVVFLS